MEFTINGKLITLKDEEKNLLRTVASQNADESANAMKSIAAMVEGAWRAGVLEPDLLDNIFDKVVLEKGAESKFPLDIYAPSKEGQYKAFVIPTEGGIPEKSVEGDEVFVPTFRIGNAISWNLNFARDARWDIVARAMEIFTNGFTQKINDNGWHVILKAAKTNSVAKDSAAASGVFTKELICAMQVAFKRLQGGRGSKLTDMFLSPEALCDLRSLTLNDIGETNLRALLGQSLDAPISYFGVNLHEMQEFGLGQEYNSYLLSPIGASLNAGDREFVVGLDLANRDSFVSPVRENMSIFDDPTLHRKQKAGVYGWLEIGFAALDTRRAMLGSF